jgi:hypothetical protein
VPLQFHLWLVSQQKFVAKTSEFAHFAAMFAQTVADEGGIPNVG